MESGLASVNDSLSKVELFESFKAQLTKDFEQCNFSIDFISALQPDFNQIHQAIWQELQRSQKKADANIMQLLYRVDIGEAMLKRYLAEQPEADALSVMAELIIKRTLQKVVIRKFYKTE